MVLYRFDVVTAVQMGLGQNGTRQSVILGLLPAAHSFQESGDRAGPEGSPRFLIFEHYPVPARELPPCIAAYEVLDENESVSLERAAAETLNLHEVAKRLRVSEKEAMLLIGPKAKNRLSKILLSEVLAAERHLARRRARTAQVSLGEGVVLRGERIIAEPPAPTPVIQITADMAALLSLQQLTGREPAPARKFRVEIKPPLDGLEAIDVIAREVVPQWKKAANTQEDLTDMLLAIAFGACGILAQQKEAAPKKESNPLGKRDAYMRDVITVKIETRISATVRHIVSDVISGRRGYSNVLRESVAVRAHFARYHTGKGGSEVTPILRAAHRRGGAGDKQRLYKVRS